MGGKNDSVAPPPVEAAPDNNDLLMQMMQMFAAQSEYAPPAIPTIPAAPIVEADPVVDWTKRQDELKSKASADYRNENKDRVGRQQTILTSPLLDEQFSKAASLLS